MRSHPVLDQLAARGIRLGVERIESFLQAMGEPHRAFPAIHVAGTNGKGSVCAFLTAILVEAGYHPGTTLSPHVEEVNERILLDGQPIDDTGLVAAIEAVDRARYDWARRQGLEGPPLTYFEFLTAAAFWVFAERKVDLGVVEVGLGGRLDATRVVQPLVCAIPSIALDHQAMLGESLAEIAVEKAGILKRGVPVVVGPMPREAREALEARARALGCPLWGPPALRRMEVDGRWQFATPDGSLDGVRLGVEGAHQGANAMVALGVVHQLRRLGLPIEDEAIRRGFARRGLPARLEEVRPGLVVDGAHNPAGARALAAWLADRPRPGTRILLVGMGEGRDPAAVVAPLIGLVDEVVTTRCAHPRARPPMELAVALADQLEGVISAGEAIEQTLPEVVAEADEVVVMGSLFVAGAARSLARSGELDRALEELARQPDEAEEA